MPEPPPPTTQRIRRGLVAVVVVLSVHLALVHFYRDVVMEGGIAERTVEQFEALRAGVDVVALGDSHVKWGIAAEEIPGAFDFALPGETYVQSYYRLRSLLEAGQPLRAVVLPADPHSLERKRRTDQPFLHYYAGFVDLCAVGRAEGSLLFGCAEWLVGRFAPYVGQRANLLAFLATGEPPEVPWLAGVPLRAGSLRSDRKLTAMSPAGRRAKAEERIRYHFGPEPAVDPVLTDYLERLLALCDERGIQVLLVRFPLSEAYLAAMPDPAAHDAAIERAVAASGSAELVDARRAFAGRASLFADVDHLNSRGAARLSRRIADRLAP